ncbi:MAG: TolB-like translocation protein, partial [Saccharofermentanales bacterium]
SQLKNVQMALPENSYKNIRWLIQDKLALIESGMDDGHYTQLLNVETMQTTEFGEAKVEVYRGWDYTTKLVIDNIPAGYSLNIQNNQTLNELCVLSVDKQINPISYLPDNTLLCLRNDPDAQKSYLSINDPDGGTSRQIGFIPGDLFPAFPSPDGKQVAIFDQYGDELYLLDVEALYNWLK